VVASWSLSSHDTIPSIDEIDKENGGSPTIHAPRAAHGLVARATNAEMPRRAMIRSTNL